MAFSLQARVVYPVERPPIERGVVTIDGERIVAIGKSAPTGPPRDLGNVALLPGLVNAHTHLEFSHLRAPLGTHGLGMADWIRLVISERARGDVDRSAAIALGLAESLAAGVTTVGEIATAPAADYAATPDGQSPSVLALLEVIGFSRARAQSALAAVKDRLAKYQLAAAKGVFPGVGISPHAPYTVSPKLLEHLIALARRSNLPVAMHLAESPEEIELLRTGGGPLAQLLDERSMWDPTAIARGTRPMDYLQLLVQAPRALVIHGNYLTIGDYELLANSCEHMSLVHCPRTHAHFGHPPFPLVPLLARGVHIAIGTDSRASNPDLDLLAELRFVARMHPRLSPDAVLKLGTLNGAAALGLDEVTGSLTPGKWADLIAVPLAGTANERPDELLAGLLHADERPASVWKGGRE